MAVKVVDASAMAAILFAEPEGDAVASRIRGESLVAPALLSFELANVCLTKLRRAPEQADRLLTAFSNRERLEIREVIVDSEAAIALARSKGLTAYDASYLWLALSLSAELVTLDRALSRAADAVKPRNEA